MIIEPVLANINLDIWSDYKNGTFFQNTKENI